MDLVAYHQLIDNAAGTVTRRITGLGGNYALTKDAKMFLGYMKRDDKGSAQSNNVYNVGVNYTIAPAVVVTVNLTQDRQSGITPGKRTVGFFGVDLVLSKRTDVYALATVNRLSGNYALPTFMGDRSSASSIIAGIRHRF